MSRRAPASLAERPERVRTADVDTGLAVVEEGKLFVLDVESEPRLTQRQTPLISEPADHDDVRGTQAVNLGKALERGGAVEVFLTESLVLDIEAVGIGHDVRNACLSCSLDELAVDVGRCTD